jgi:hypothetical protein
VKKYLIGWTATTRGGVIATGRSFSTTESLTQEAIENWESLITEANNFRNTSITSIVKLEG